MVREFKPEDFKTPYAKKACRRLSSQIDYKLLKRFLPDDADEDSFSIPKLDLSKGIGMNSNELKESFNNMNTLASFFIFERVFGQCIEEQELEDFLNDENKNELRDGFEERLRYYPVEATIIRANIRFPAIQNNDKLRKKVTEKIKHLMAMGFSAIPRGRTALVTYYFGNEPGPREIPLRKDTTDPEKDQLNAYYNSWYHVDLMMKETFPILAEGPPPPGYKFH